MENALAEIKPQNDRILQANFSGNPYTTIVVNYAPVEGSELAGSHYEKLNSVINDIPKHNMIIELGDFNAHLGKEHVRHMYHEHSNSNGNLLHDHALECGLIITNTMYEKRRGKLWTFISDMSGAKSQIDFILVNKKWKNSVKNTEAYSSFSSMGSDHRLLTSRVKLSLRTTKSIPRKKTYDWNTLRNSELQNLYTVTVKNRYAELSTESDDATESYGKFVQANREATEQLIPTKKRKKRDNTAGDPRVKEARENVQNAFTQYQIYSSSDNQNRLQAEKTKLADMYDTVQEEELLEMIKQVESADAKSKHGESWKLINKISGRTSAKRGIIKGNSKEERVKRWFQHFSNLLGKEPVITADNNEELPAVLKDLGINDNPFTINELHDAKRSLREGKASGPDDITPEIIKRCNFDNIILLFANKLLLENVKPDQWSIIDLLPIPK